MDTKKVGGNSPSAVDAFRPQQAERAEQASGSNKEKKAKQAAAQGAAAADTYDVNLSPRARELMDARRKATEIARATPDVRDERVAELRKKIQNGTYQMQPEKVADGMLQEAMRDEVAMQMHEDAKSR